MPQPKPENPPLAPVDIPPLPKKSYKGLWIIACLSIVALCLCSIICIATIALGVRGIIVERAPVESVLDTYMKDMMAKDVESAYALFSPRAQKKLAISDLQELTEGNNYILFEGYRNLSIQNFNVTAGATTNPDAPQGIVARVTGIINYEGGFQGSINAILEKVDGKWQLDSAYVMVPPNKFPP